MDNADYHKGEPAGSNAQLVERTVRIANELTLEPAHRTRPEPSLA